MLISSDNPRGSAARIWPTLTMLIVVAVGGAALHITNGPWWVGSLASLATIAVFWAIERAAGKKRGSAREPG
jgi:hypothetical protein